MGGRDTLSLGLNHDFELDHIVCCLPIEFGSD